MNDTMEIWSLLDDIISKNGKQIKDSLNKMDLTITDYKVMRMVRKNDEPMKNIASELALANGWVTDIVDRLEKKGYLIRIHDEGDRRIVKVSLTPSGRDVSNKIKEFLKNTIENSLKNLNNDEIDSFKKILSKINNKISNEGIEK